MKCPICGLRAKKFSKSFLPYYYKCLRCRGHFIGKVKKVKYPESYFDDGKNFSWLSTLFEIPLNLFLDYRFSYIKNIVDKKRAKILDYGCGSGKLVKRLQKDGYQITGFEPSLGALKITKRQKLPVYNKVKPVKGGYDLIMFWHSLEHTDNPRQVIKKATNLLSTNGRLLIGVPNANSWNAKIGLKRWFHYTYPLHKVHFTPASMPFLLESTGLKIKKIDFFNPEYTLSSLIQTLLNFILPHDVLYSFVAHRRSTLHRGKVIFYSFISLILVILFTPFILTLFFSELILKKTDAMLVTAWK